MRYPPQHVKGVVVLSRGDDENGTWSPFRNGHTDLHYGVLGTIIGGEEIDCIPTTMSFELPLRRRVPYRRQVREIARVGQRDNTDGKAHELLFGQQQWSVRGVFARLRLTRSKLVQHEYRELVGIRNLRYLEVEIGFVLKVFLGEKKRERKRVGKRISLSL